MDITESSAGAVKVAAMKGRLDAATASGAEAKLLGLLAGGAKLVVDLAEVGYVSSAGLRVLLLAAKQAKAGGGAFALAAPQAGVMEVLQISGFHKILAIHDTRDAAVAALG
jgi:anti-anti-sigma factor